MAPRKKKPSTRPPSKHDQHISDAENLLTDSASVPECAPVKAEQEALAVVTSNNDETPSPEGQINDELYQSVSDAENLLTDSASDPESSPLKAEGKALPAAPLNIDEIPQLEGQINDELDQSVSDPENLLTDSASDPESSPLKAEGKALPAASLNIDEIPQPDSQSKEEADGSASDPESSPLKAGGEALPVTLSNTNGSPQPGRQSDSQIREEASSQIRKGCQPHTYSARKNHGEDLSEDDKGSRERDQEEEDGRCNGLHGPNNHLMIFVWISGQWSRFSIRRKIVMMALLLLATIVGAQNGVLCSLGLCRRFDDTFSAGLLQNKTIEAISLGNTRGVDILRQTGLRWDVPYEIDQLAHNLQDLGTIYVIWSPITSKEEIQTLVDLAAKTAFLVSDGLRDFNRDTIDSMSLIYFQMLGFQQALSWLEREKAPERIMSAFKPIAIICYNILSLNRVPELLNVQDMSQSIKLALKSLASLFQDPSYKNVNYEVKVLLSVLISEISDEVNGLVGQSSTLRNNVDAVRGNLTSIRSLVVENEKEINQSPKEFLDRIARLLSRYGASGSNSYNDSLAMLNRINNTAVDATRTIDETKATLNNLDADLRQLRDNIPRMEGPFMRGAIPVVREQVKKIAAGLINVQRAVDGEISEKAWQRFAELRRPKGERQQKLPEGKKG